MGCCASANLKYVLYFFNNGGNDGIDESFVEDPDITMKILFFYRRDFKYKGRYRKNIQYLATEYTHDFRPYINLLAEKGTYKDLLFLFGTPLEADMIEIYCNQLWTDHYRYWHYEPFSLAAKYAPSLGGHYDKHYNAARKFAVQLGLNKGAYRKLLSKLRRGLYIIERQIEHGEFGYTPIPKGAWRKHENLLRLYQTPRPFIKNEGDRCTNALSNGKLPAQKYLSWYRKYRRDDLNVILVGLNPPNNLHLFMSYIQVKNREYTASEEELPHFIRLGMRNIIFYDSENVLQDDISAEISDLDPTLYANGTEIIVVSPRGYYNISFEDNIYYITGLNDVVLMYLLTGEEVSIESYLKECL